MFKQDSTLLLLLGHSRRIIMDDFMKLITIALEWTAERGKTEVRAETLEAAAEVFTLRRDAIRVIDGEGANDPRPAS